MAVSGEIVRSWRGPGAAVRRQLAAGIGEARALACLTAACFLIFVAQWPRLSREAHLSPEVPLDARIAAAAFALIFVAPLFFYGLAALSHLLARAFGGQGTWFTARVALFWSLLAAAPLFLFQGLVAGFVGPGPALTTAEAITALGFLAHWILALSEAERLAAA